MTSIHTPNPLQGQKYRMPEPIHQDKTQTKVIVYWLGIFLIASATGVLSPAGCLAISTIFICAVPLYRRCAVPLYRRVQTTRAYKFIFKREPDNSLKEQVVAESIRQRARIADLTARIRMIDRFVLERPDLRRIVEEHIAKYGEYIAFGQPQPSIDVLRTNDWLYQYTILGLQIIDLEHWLNERKRFIESHTEVRQCFEKHLLALKRT